MVKHVFTLLLFTIILGSCEKSISPIAAAEDYDRFLNPVHLNAAKSKLLQDVSFWSEKLKNSPGNHLYEIKLAGLYAAQYKLIGDVQLLHDSDQILKSIHTKLPNHVSVLHMLTANAITKHAFKDARKFAQKAYDIGEKKHTSSLLIADVALESGRLYEAHQMMQDLIATNQFDYLIRNVKIKDHQGNLKEAIENMEEALEKASTSGKSNLINWSLSNLADMYGHDGRIEKSYETYLAALTENPADLHSLKGIAWILFSHDKNPKEAKRIINFLKTVHPVPDYDLLLAKIAYFENQIEIAQELEQFFLTEAIKTKYNNMYKSYICTIKINNQSINEALEIANQEVEERPSPVVYDLLAWTAFHNDQLEKAVNISQQFVNGQTEEPITLFHRGVIFKKAGKEKEAKKYLVEALDASYELGPLISKEIQTHLKNM